MENTNNKVTEAIDLLNKSQQMLTDHFIQVEKTVHYYNELVNFAKTMKVSAELFLSTGTNINPTVLIQDCEMILKRIGEID